jgi:hypothetical protein
LWGNKRGKGEEKRDILVPQIPVSGVADDKRPMVPSTATIGRRRAIPVPPQPTRSGLRPGTRSYQREHPYQILLERYIIHNVQYHTYIFKPVN